MSVFAADSAAPCPFVARFSERCGGLRARLTSGRSIRSPEGKAGWSAPNLEDQTMYLILSKKPRKSVRSRSKRYKAKLKAKDKGRQSRVYQAHRKC